MKYGEQDSESGAEDSVLIFKKLRDEGIALMQNFSGELWTDYNLHDPGVTILEQLCFAITDLAYRGEFKIEELLTDRNGKINFSKNSFHSKHKILSSSPSNFSDLKKIIIDHYPEVQNIWFTFFQEPEVKGVIAGGIKVLLLLKRDLVTGKLLFSGDINESKYIRELETSIFQKLVSNRNFCEVFQTIKTLEKITISVAGEVSVKENQIAEDVLCRIFVNLNQLINPSIKFYSEQEMVTMGYGSPEIFNGPLLKGGFILDQDLNQEKSAILDISDIVNVILATEGVLYAHGFYLQIKGSDERLMQIHITTNNYLSLDINEFDSNIILYNNKYKHTISRSLFKSFVINSGMNLGRKPELQKNESHHTPSSLYKDFSKYFSIQRLFPLIYGLGEAGIEKQSNTSQKASLKQLKAYLVLFEQILASHLAQLGNLKNLFTMDPSQPTYFVQGVYDVPYLKDILAAYTPRKDKSDGTVDTDWEKFKEDPDNDYMRALRQVTEPAIQHLSRKNRLADHILARYNQNISSFSVSSFSRAYKLGSEYEALDLLNFKVAIYNNIENFGIHRSNAHNYLVNRTVTQFEKMMLLLLNVKRCNPDLTDLRSMSSGHDAMRLTAMFVSNGNSSIESNTGRTNLGQITFQEINNSFFKDAINLEHYCICHDENNMFRINYFVRDGECVIDRECPGRCIHHADHASYEKKDEFLVGIYNIELDAAEALKNLIRCVKAMNINSEGFHIIEHILLLPPVDSNSFTFHFFNKTEDSPMFYLRAPVTFEERNKIISDIVKVFQEKNRDNQERLLKSLRRIHTNLCFQDPHENETGKEHLERLLNEIRNRDLSYSVFEGFKLYVKISTFNFVIESFFDMKVTVVLPSWPVRFQSEDFIQHVKHIFNEYLPAHITVSFLLLDIQEMITFENALSKWNDGNKEGLNSSNSLELLNFILPESYLKPDVYCYL